MVRFAPFLLSIILSGLLGSVGIAAVPFKFEPHKPAKASEVNQNFEYLDNEIRARSHQICEGNDASDQMVRVGPLCIDKYEASVWQNPDGTGKQFGAISAAETGTEPHPGDNYPCKDNGNDCSSRLSFEGNLLPNKNAIYARSVPGAIPSRYITWFQAQQACLNSGKRLLTNAEWQMAAAGTPEPVLLGTDSQNNPIIKDIDNGSTDCSTYSSLFFGSYGNTPDKKRGESLPVPTGSRSKCVSNWGVYDMVGNLWEWVADWTQGSNISSTATLDPTNNTITVTYPGFGGVSSADYGSDAIAGVIPASGQSAGNSYMPAAIYRGANGRDNYLSGVFAYSSSLSPAVARDDIGFRCAK